jgi:hypothetical protein
MRKLIFSIIAIMAFSVNSFAFNNIELNTNENLNFIEVENSILEVEIAEVDCWQVANATEAAYNQQTGNTDPYVSFPIWQAAYETCERNKRNTSLDP